jgi:hypothetical protein
MYHAAMTSLRLSSVDGKLFDELDAFGEGSERTGSSSQAPTQPQPHRASETRRKSWVSNTLRIFGFRFGGSDFGSDSGPGLESHNAENSTPWQWFGEEEETGHATV